MTQQQDNIADSSSTDFPPPGWVTKDEAARMLGVSFETLANAKWVRRLSAARYARRPDGGRCKIYPLAEIEQIAQERAAAVAALEAKERAAAEEAAARAAGPPFVVPEGFVDRAERGACSASRRGRSCIGSPMERSTLA